MSDLPKSFTYEDHDAGTVARWTPAEVINLKKGGEVIICHPGRTPFRRQDCVNKHRRGGVVTTPSTSEGGPS